MLPDLSWMTPGGGTAPQPSPGTPDTGIIVGGADISWMAPGGATARAPSTAEQPTMPVVTGIDDLSESGRSYKTLFASKEFLAADSKQRTEQLDKWERTDALARAAANGDSPAQIKADLAAVRRKFAARYGEQNVIDGAKDIVTSVLSGFAGLVKNIGDVYGLTSGNTYNLVSEAGKQAQDYWNENKSEILKTREKDNARQVAEADGVLDEFWTALKGTASDPVMFTSFAATQLPQLLPGLLIGRGAALLAKGAGAVAQATIGTSAAVGTGALLQGSDVGSDTYEAALKASRKAQPELTNEEHQGIALYAARQAAVAAGLVSLAVGMIPGASNFERVLVTGKAGKGGIGAVLKAGLKEGVLSELPEEALGKVSGNLALREIDPTQSITEGAGAAGALGFLGGTTLAGVAQLAASGTPPAPAPALSAPPAPPAPSAPASPNTPTSAGGSAPASTGPILPAGVTVEKDLGGGNLWVRLADGTTGVYTAQEQARTAKARADAAEAVSVAAAVAPRVVTPAPVLPTITPTVVAENTNPTTYEADPEQTYLPRLQEGESAEMAGRIGYKPAETAAEATARLADALVESGDPTSLELRQTVIDGHVDAYNTYIADQILAGLPTAGIGSTQFRLDIQEEIDAALINKGITLDTRRTRAAAKVLAADPGATRLEQGSRLQEDGRFLSEAAYLDTVNKRTDNANPQATIQENTAAGVFAEAQRVDTGSVDGAAQSAQSTDPTNTATAGQKANGRGVSTPANAAAPATNQKPVRQTGPTAGRSRLTSKTQANRDTTLGNQQSTNDRPATTSTAAGTVSNGSGLPARVPGGDSGSGVSSTGRSTKSGVAYVSPVGGNPVVRYNEGRVGYKPVFVSTYDRDAYMAQSAKPGKSDSAIAKAVVAAGISLENFATHGALVKRYVQDLARESQGGTATAPMTINVTSLSTVTSAKPAAETTKKNRLGSKQGGAVGTGLLRPIADALRTAFAVPGKVMTWVDELAFNQKGEFQRAFDLDPTEFDNVSQTAINRNTTVNALASARLQETLRTLGTLSTQYNVATGNKLRSLVTRTTDEVKKRLTSSREFVNGANAYALARWVPDGNKELRERRVAAIAEITVEVAAAQKKADGFKQAVAQPNPTENLIAQKVEADKRLKELKRQERYLNEGLALFDSMDATATFQQMIDAADAAIGKTIARRVKDPKKKAAMLEAARRQYMIGSTAGLSTFDAMEMQANMEAKFGAAPMRAAHASVMKSHLAIREVQDRYQAYLPGEFQDLATDPYAATRLPTEFANNQTDNTLNAEKASAFRNGSHTARRSQFESSIVGGNPPVDVLIGIERFAGRVGYQSGVGEFVQYLANQARKGNTKIKVLTDAEFDLEYNATNRTDSTQKRKGDNRFQLYEKRVRVDAQGNATTFRMPLKVVFDSGNFTQDSSAAVAMFNTINGTKMKAVRELGTGKGETTIQDTMGNTYQAEYAPWLAGYRETVNMLNRGLTYTPTFVIYNQELSDALSKQRNMVNSGILERANGTKLNAGKVKLAQEVIRQNTSRVVRSFVDGARAVATGVLEAGKIEAASIFASPYQKAALKILDGAKSSTPEAVLLQRLMDDGTINLRGNTHLDTSTDANVRRALRAGAKDADGTGAIVGAASRMSAYILWVQRQRSVATMSIAARTVDTFMKQGATYESATAAYRYAYDETKLGSVVTSAWASNVSFLAASSAEIGAALRSLTAQPLTPSRAGEIATIVAMGIGVSAMLKYALSYASVLMGGGESDEEKRKAFGNKQQQQRATESMDTLFAYGMILSMPTSYNPMIQLDKAVAAQAINSLDDREFDERKVAGVLLRSLAGPFGSYRFNSVSASDKPEVDFLLATVATAVGANPFTEAVITAMTGRDVFGRQDNSDKYARAGDVKLPNDETAPGRIAGALSALTGTQVKESSVKNMLNTLPYLKGATNALGVNRFVRDDTAQFTPRVRWSEEAVKLKPLIEKMNLQQQRNQRASGEPERNLQFSGKSRPTEESFKTLGATDKEAAKLVIYYEVTAATGAALTKQDRIRRSTKLGKAEDDSLYGLAVNRLRELEKQ